MYYEPKQCDHCDKLLPPDGNAAAAPPITPSAPTLSIIVPLLNEAEVLDQTYRRLKEVLDRLGETYELIFVDDGSTDSSRVLLTARALEDPTVRVIGLSRN